MGKKSNNTSAILISVVIACLAAAGATGYFWFIPIWSAEAAVRQTLRDPDSAKFSDVSIRDGAVCGAVNAKNAYGGYVGTRRFVFAAKTALIDPGIDDRHLSSQSDEDLNDEIIFLKADDRYCLADAMKPK